MQIIAHRGLWNSCLEERNTSKAFIKSFRENFGTETDIRDYLGKLVISHDPANEKCLIAREFFRIYKENGNNLPLALNVKADGLQDMLLELLNEFDIKNYFVFDMSLPDSLLYLKKDMNAFTRESEYEKVPLFYEKACGVWIDCFHSDWIDGTVIRKHIEAGKKVCLVSPDLHKRDYLESWKKLKSNDIWKNENLILCTDFPSEARRYFCSEN